LKTRLVSLQTWSPLSPNLSDRRVTDRFSC